MSRWVVWEDAGQPMGVCPKCGGDSLQDARPDLNFASADPRFVDEPCRECAGLGEVPDFVAAKRMTTRRSA